MSAFAVRWAHLLISASWQGGLAFCLLWLLCRYIPRLSPRLRCWLWRLAYLKLLLTFLGLSPLPLPLLPAPPSEPVPVAVPAPAGVRPLPGAGQTGNPLPNSLSEAMSTFCLAFWLIGAGASAIRLGREGVAMQRLRRRSAPESDAVLMEQCAQLCRQFGLRRPPLLLRLEGGGSPQLIGGIAPAILLPSELCAVCAPEELRLMLAHELAHLKRRDLWWGWLPALSQCLFCFHPLVWAANRQWNLAQELACDELTLRVTRAGAGDYGTALLKAAAQSVTTGRRGLAVVSRDEFPQSLAQRLSALRTPLAGATRLSRVGLSAALIGLIPWQVVARSLPARPTAVVAPQRAGGDQARPQWLKRTLGQTERQVAQLQDLVVTTDRRAMRLHETSGLSDAERERIGFSLFDTAKADIQATLTPEQRQTLQQTGGIKAVFLAFNPEKGKPLP